MDGEEKVEPAPMELSTKNSPSHGPVPAQRGTCTGTTTLDASSTAVGPTHATAAMRRPEVVSETINKQSVQRGAVEPSSQSSGSQPLLQTKAMSSLSNPINGADMPCEGEATSHPTTANSASTDTSAAADSNVESAASVSVSDQAKAFLEQPNSATATESHNNKPSVSSAIGSSHTTEGNDRVTLDLPPKEPLIAAEIIGEDASSCAAPGNVIISPSPTILMTQQQQEGRDPSDNVPTKPIESSSLRNNSDNNQSNSATSQTAHDDASGATVVDVVVVERELNHGKPPPQPPPSSLPSLAVAPTTLQYTSNNNSIRNNNPTAPSTSPKPPPSLSLQHTGSDALDDKTVVATGAVGSTILPSHFPAGVGVGSSSSSSENARQQAAPQAISSSSISNNSDSRPPAASFQQAIQLAAHEEAVNIARAPLVNIYGNFLCHSTDGSLSEARNRLKKAIAQTRELRQTFTERVYGKYRVCLRQPLTADEIFANILADPVGLFRKLKEEMAAIREEKEIEKKEATKLNNEMSQSSGSDRLPLLLNIDNAEQLMYFTAGLNLVILPEEQLDRNLQKEYTDRGPVDNATGQRARFISQAAASAGEVILDRTRKAAAMRVERQRRRQLQLLRGEVVADGEAESNYSRLQVLSIAGSSSSSTQQPASNPASSSRAAKIAPTTTGVKQATATSRRASASAGKNARSRTQASLPTNILLSLNPTADEVKIETKPCAATLALIARGVGSIAAKTTQQRLRHPHPDSLGGRRRATVNPNAAKKDDDLLTHPPEPFLQAYLVNTLPPLPAAKDRLDRKPLPVAVAHNTALDRALASIHRVVEHFVDENDKQSLAPISKISLLKGLRRLNRESTKETNSTPPSSATTPPVDASPLPSGGLTPPCVDTPLNPALTLSVMFALGIVGRTENSTSKSAFLIPTINNDNSGFTTGKLLRIKGKIYSGEKSLTEFILRRQITSQSPSPGKRTRSSSSGMNESKEKRSRVDDAQVKPDDLCVPAQSIRGGGDITLDDDNQNGNSDPSNPNQTDSASSDGIRSNSTTLSGEQKKRKRSESSPGRPSPTSLSRVGIEQITPTVLPAPAPLGYLGTQQSGVEQFTQNTSMNALQIANQLRQMHHPSAGDLAQYLGSFQLQPQRSFDIAALMSGAGQTQMSTYGFMHPNSGLVGYSLSDQSVAAGALLVREQQTAAILGGYPSQANEIPQVASHHTSFLSGLNSSVLPSQQHGSLENCVSQPTNLFVHSTDQDQRTSKSERTSSNVHEDASTAADGSKFKNSARAVISVKREVPDDTNTEMDSKPSAVPMKDRGCMTFVVPAHPSNLSLQRASDIQRGYFHKVAADLDQSDYSTAVDFLLSVGAAVPIPKGLVLGPLKERLNTPGFKNVGSNSAPLVTRDVVAAVILIWLWTTNEKTFQRAFERNGRIDVDLDCKWLIQAAVDTAVGELSLEIAESMARGEGAFAEASAGRKVNTSVSGVESMSNAESVHSLEGKKLDVCTASIVSQALTVEMCIDADMNIVIPKFAHLVEFLDEARLGALRSKSQERVLLATLVSRTTFMTDAFSQAYVSAIVRAGEALGHGRLFEVAQDETVTSSTMIPYDIFTDATGAWEDPCKPDNGFISGISGDELMRRAHARAMIHKSLRKLQDRLHIRGGTSTYGPFDDPTTNSVSASKGLDGFVASPRPGAKRKLAQTAEPPMVPGTGSAAAKSWTVYNPKHHCRPLEWDFDELENSPYGLHPRGDGSRVRPMVAGRRHSGNDQSRNRIYSNIVAGQHLESFEPIDGRSILSKSTIDIDWAEVASIFQSVEVPKKAPRYRPSEPEKPIAVDGTIFAPFCREMDSELSSNEAESDTDEDLDDATTLARHQDVLDSMKEKLEAFVEARKKQQEQRKNRYTK